MPEKPTPSADDTPPRRTEPPIADPLAPGIDERDVWDLEDAAPPESESKVKGAERLKMLVEGEPGGAAKQPVPVLKRGSSSVVMRITGGRRMVASPSKESLTPARQVKSGSVEATFDDLEHWTEPEEVADEPLEDIPESEPMQPETPEVWEQGEAAVAPQVAAEPARGEPTDEVDGETGDDEFSPRKALAAAPVKDGGRRRFVLSVPERVGILVFVLVLVVGGWWAYRASVGRLAAPPPNALSVLPTQGTHLRILKIETYWRAPVVTGPGRESVRRGVRFIPVAEVTVSGSGALRGIFCDEHGEDAGDPVIRAVDGETKLVLAATAGFEDQAALTAYQAGLVGSWQIKLAEAPTTTSSGAEFVPVAVSAVDSALK